MCGDTASISFKRGAGAGMATEIKPGVFTSLFLQIDAQAEAKSQLALTRLAIEVEHRAQSDLSRLSHRYGTKTPASPGGPPAKISGNLARSVTHTMVARDGVGWSTRVGTRPGLYPWYSHRTPANLYGRYLETGLRNGSTYPWLVPAFRWAVAMQGPMIYREVYGTGWRRLA